jgi:hypothetical protein
MKDMITTNICHIETDFELIPGNQLTIIPDHICDYEDFKCQFESQVPFYEKTDYIVAASSGILTAALDILLVGSTTLKDTNSWGTEQINDFVIKAAQKLGYRGNDLQGAVRHFEKYHIPGDAAMSSFGGGLQHHFRDYSHHPSESNIWIITSSLKQCKHLMKVLRYCYRRLYNPRKMVQEVSVWARIV